MSNSLGTGGGVGFGRVMEIESCGQGPGFGGPEGLLEGPQGVHVEILPS